MSGIDALLKVAHQYEVAAKVPATTVSWRVFGDSKKLTAMRESGADISVRRLEGAMRWFSENWPPNAVWPTGVERPRAEAPAGTGAAA